MSTVGTPGVNPNAPIRCPWCEFVAENLTYSLRGHVKTLHKIDERSLWNHLFGGPRFCRCGCGQETSFKTISAGYSHLCHGHGKRKSRVDFTEPETNEGMRLQMPEQLAAGTPWDERTTASTNMSQMFRCGHCDFKTRQPNRFANHLLEHGIEPLVEYVCIHHDGVHPTCSCGCDQKLTWYGWSRGFSSQFLKGHNYSSSMHTDQAKSRALENRLQFYRKGGKVWNAGLSNETDPRVKQMHEKCKLTIRLQKERGTYKSWHALHPEKARLLYQKRGAALRLTANDVLKRLANLPMSLTLLSSLDKDYQSRQVTLLDFRCNVCNTNFQRTLKNIEDTPRCFTCHPKESYNQIEIYDFVRSLLPEGETVEMSTRGILPGNRELDIYVPSRKFAIEFNGLTFHTERDVPASYHWDKTRDCSMQGIQLLHVFGDEWRIPHKQLIVKSMIRHRLHGSLHVFNARDCELRELSPVERRNFFEGTHLDGDVRATVAWGLIKDGKIVTALSLRKPRGSRYADHWEIARSSSTLDTCVRGGLSRLMKQAIQWARAQGGCHMLSYVDLRSGTGRSYEQTGFVESHVTPCRFWWVDRKFSERIDRFSIRADPARGLSEAQVAAETGHVRIYGCPNRVLTLNLS